MTPRITLLVATHDGRATALAEIGRRRAHELGLGAEIVPLVDVENSGLARGSESVTAVVPTEFAATHHEAWCVLCQLSLLRSDVNFAILVLGAATSSDFEQRQKNLLVNIKASPIQPARRSASAA